MQHQAQKRINNPNLNARLANADQAVQTANMTFADVQAKAAQAKERLSAQPQQQKPEVQQQQRTDPVDTKPQQPTTVPSQPQQPQTQPETPEQKRRKRERTDAEKADTRARMDAAGQAQGLPN